MIAENVNIPARQTRNSCGYDFYAPHDIALKPGQWVKIDTGVCFDGTEEVYVNCQTADHWFMMLAPRSSYGMKYGLRFSNTVGIIDQDYRDNICAEMTVERELTIKAGERFMQGIFIPYGRMVYERTPTKQRSGGMGSTDN